MLRIIKACQNEDGGIAATEQHDSHILHTLSAVQVNFFDNFLTPFLGVDNFESFGYNRC